MVVEETSNPKTRMIKDITKNAQENEFLERFDDPGGSDYGIMGLVYCGKVHLVFSATTGSHRGRGMGRN